MAKRIVTVMDVGEKLELVSEVDEVSFARLGFWDSVQLVADLQALISAKWPDQRAEIIDVVH